MCDSQRHQTYTEFELAIEQRPSSSKRAIVFPWLTNKYSKEDLNPVHIEGRVTEAEIDEVLSKLQNHKLANPNTRTLYLLIIPCVLLISFMLLILFVKGGPPKISKAYRIAATSLVILSFLLFCGCFANSSERNFRRWKEREVAFDEILDQVNEKEFGERGIRWRVGKFGAWVILELSNSTAREGSLQLPGGLIPDEEASFKKTSEAKIELGRL